MSHQRVLGICADSRGMVNLGGFRSHARHWQDILIYLAQTLLSGHSELDLSSLLCAGTLLLASSLPGPCKEVATISFPPASSSHSPPSRT